MPWYVPISKDRESLELCWKLSKKRYICLIQDVRQATDMSTKIKARGEHIACSTTTALNVGISAAGLALSFTYRQVEKYKKLGFGGRGMKEMISPWNTWSLYVLSMKL